MDITVKPFARGSSAIRLAYGKMENGQFVPAADVRKASNFSEFGSRKVSGKFGTPNYTEEYHLDLEGKKSIFAVQKWVNIGTTSPEKVWEVIYQPEEKEQGNEKAV
jgi:hypothetical protein